MSLPAGVGDPKSTGNGVVAVVLSYNSRSSLSRVVAAIGEQSLAPGRLIIVDNASTDGTRAYLDSIEDLQGPMEVRTILLERNVGVGAGHWAGWRAALEDPGCGWVWVLEHDCVPFPDCLADLLARAEGARRASVKIGAVGSELSRNLAEYSTDRDPSTGSRRVSGGARPSPRFTFNGVLLARSAIELSGPPRVDFFCGQEDWEYSVRLRRQGFELLQGGGWALHSSKGNHRYGVRPSVLRSYYATRNTVYLRARSGGLLAKAGCALRVGPSCMKIAWCDDKKARRMSAKAAATFDGLTGRMGKRSYRFMEPH